MSTQQYKEINLRRDTIELIDYINKLIVSYQAQGYTLSVRQLYYQLVARAVVENTEKSYKRVASIINDGRLCGLIDWDAIEDRGRDIVMRGRWSSGASIIDSCAYSYHMDMWETQEARMFVIVEKAALAGVLDGVCHKYDVPLLAARGYPSVSVLRELTLEHVVPSIEAGQHVTILHLGDHDPSGIDMTRDLGERIVMFTEGAECDTTMLTINRIALSMRQIEEKKPPPNPAKTTDARFADYRRKYGDESWELDALEPSYMVDLVTRHIKVNIDDAAWQARETEIVKVKTQLKKTAARFRKDGV